MRQVLPRPPKAQRQLRPHRSTPARLFHERRAERQAGEVHETSRHFPSRTLEETRPGERFPDPAGLGALGYAEIDEEQR
eukprot:9273604-Pyramimonas_sp.AAC.1